jgi:hypothetical protein
MLSVLPHEGGTEMQDNFARPDDAPRGDGGIFMVGFYARPDGRYEKVYMPKIDFFDALERDPEHWSELPPPPGSEIIDRTEQGLPGKKVYHGAA